MTAMDSPESGYFDRAPFSLDIRRQSVAAAQHVVKFVALLPADPDAVKEELKRERQLVLQRAALMTASAGLFTEPGDPRIVAFVDEFAALVQKYSPAAEATP